VKTLTRWGVGVSTTTVAFVLFAGATLAQQPALVAPVTKAAITPAAAQTEPKKPARRAASKCQRLDEMICGATPGCTWVAATKTKAGKDVKAYCRTRSKTRGKPATPAATKPGESTKE
jgi:hypothetical protein